MSLVFADSNSRQAPDHVATVQKLLDENAVLIHKIRDCQREGRADEAVQFQRLLHRNLVYLAKFADQSLLPHLGVNPQPAQPPQSQSAHVMDNNMASPAPPRPPSQTANAGNAGEQIQIPPPHSSYQSQPQQQPQPPVMQNSQLQPPPMNMGLSPGSIPNVSVSQQQPQMQHGHPQMAPHPGMQHHQQYYQHQQSIPPVYPQQPYDQQSMNYHHPSASIAPSHIQQPPQHYMNMGQQQPR